MTISFNQIPNNLRVPLFYAEFDNSLAVQGGAAQEYKVLMVGQKLAAGTQAALSPVDVTSAEQAQSLFGSGSMLADMVAKYLEGNRFNSLTCVALEDLGAAVKAAGKVAFGGTPTAAGIVELLIGGRQYRVGVSASDTPDDIATNAAALIQADPLRVIDAAPNGTTASELDLTARNGGEVGNDIQIVLNYFSGQVLPTGITAVITPMASGAGNPDLATILPVIGETQRILWCIPYTDAANLTVLEQELADRFGPIRANDGYGIMAKNETLANLTTLGESRNSQFTTIMSAKGPNTSWQWAAALTAQIAAAGEIDPARPFQTLELVGILPALEEDRFTLEERNMLLFDGIATSYVDSGGVVRIEAVITTFKENAFGSPDTSYLYLNTPLTLSFLRFDLRARITSRFPRHKLANDGTRFGAGQAVVTPNSIKAEVVAKFREWEEKALVENFDQFKEELIVERNADNPNRVDLLLPPDLVNQLRLVATKIQFRL